MNPSTVLGHEVGSRLPWEGGAIVDREEAATADGQLEVLPVAVSLERWLDLSA